jgi:ketosteroid isomerase-like protein
VDDREQQVRELNARFYAALERLDLDAMDALWLHADWVRCTHPGWEVVIGWPAVRASWETVFANTQWMRVTTTAVDVRLLGELGLVGCSENITAAQDAELGVAVAQATNLFVETPVGWRMIHHHASQVPVHVTQPFSGRVQ